MKTGVTGKDSKNRLNFGKVLYYVQSLRNMGKTAIFICLISCLLTFKNLEIFYWLIVKMYGVILWSMCNYQYLNYFLTSDPFRFAINA